MNRTLLFLCLCVSLASATFAQHIGTMAYQVTKTTNAPAGSLPAGDRFLFLVDTSLSMRKFDAANRQALFDMIFSGLRGRMRDGDTYGIWTFNAQTYPGLFQMQTWKQEETMQQASRAALFLKQQPYEHDTQMGIAFVKLDTVVRAVRDLHILIISDGDTTVQGTPFDSAINAGYEKRNAQRKKAKQPFVTTIVAREGKLVSAAVTIAGEAIQLPERVEPPAIVKAATVKPEAKPVEILKPKGVILSLSTNVAAPQPLGAESTNVSGPALGSTPSNPPPVIASIINTSNSDLNPPKEPAGTTPASPPERIASASAPSAIRLVAEQKPAVAASAAATNLEGNARAAIKGAAPLAPLQTSPAASPSAPMIVFAREPSSDATDVRPETTRIVPVVASQSFFSPGVMFLTGLGLLIAAMGLLLLCAGRLRPATHASWISQSMDRR